MKIALAQLNYHIGNFESNTAKIIRAINKAKEQNADLIVFAELAVSGYPPRDFLEFDDFIECCSDSLKTIAGSCVEIAAIVGVPSFNTDDQGKRLFNSAAFIAEGEVKAMIGKTLLPNYDVFDEYRYFEPNRKFEIIHYKGISIAITICEDLWNITDDPLYVINPVDELMKMNPGLLINVAASPFNYKQAEIRKNILCKNAEVYCLPLFYVNHVGAQTELLFDGGSMVINPSGRVIDELAYFEEDFRVYDLDNVISKAFDNNYKPDIKPKFELIHDALVMGIRNYFEKLGFKKAILGLSGGIDSAVTLVLACRALGNENVNALLLPSPFSSDHSVDDAVALAENLNCSYDMINISDAYNTFIGTLEPHFKGLPFSIAEENIQARIRAVLLMAFTNKFGYILLNTSNKSEAAVGYGTLYGDMCGGLSVLGDVYKTEVYELAEFINKSEEIIPLNTITKPPSAELKFDQKDSDSLPDYEILDKILFRYLEELKSPKQIIAQGFDEAIVRKTLKLVNTNEYKRYQTPPVLRVSTKAFGMGRRMPIVGKYLS